MSDAFHTHGAFSWCELQTDDADKAAAFYKDVIGWEIEEMAMPGGTYIVLKAGGNRVGGIFKRPPEMAGGPVRWASYVTVDDVDKCVAAAKAGGAQILIPAFDIESIGRMATFRDPVGAVISVIKYEEQA